MMMNSSLRKNLNNKFKNNNRVRKRRKKREVKFRVIQQSLPKPNKSNKKLNNYKQLNPTKNELD